MCKPETEAYFIAECHKAPGELMTLRVLPLISVAIVPLALVACVTPARMHTEAQLNDVALGCGLAMGELMQDESEKRLLFMMSYRATNAQRTCVAQWARRNHLHLATLEGVHFE